MQDLNNILKTFEPINLMESEPGNLFDRIDTKFVFGSDRLLSFLQKLPSQYKVLEVNNERCCRYRSLYFDTTDLHFYLQHHNGILTRYKVRYRSYTESNQCFFEIKLKRNTNRTIKERITWNCIEPTISGEAGEFLHQYTGMNASDLTPALWVLFSRITLVNRTSPERVTIDIDLNYSKNTISKSFPGMVIAEVKQPHSAASPFITIMKESKIRRNTISKYCFGICSTYQYIKKNNFKSNLLSINKLCYD